MPHARVRSRRFRQEGALPSLVIGRRDGRRRLERDPLRLVQLGLPLFDLLKQLVRLTIGSPVTALYLFRRQPDILDAFQQPVRLGGRSQQAGSQRHLVGIDGKLVDHIRVDAIAARHHGAELRAAPCELGRAHDRLA